MAVHPVCKVSRILLLGRGGVTPPTDDFVFYLCKSPTEFKRKGANAYFPSRSDVPFSRRAISLQMNSRRVSER